MTKFEFLGDLSRLIADLPSDEREQAMEYYEDYFADAGPEKEQEIIKDFISPSFIAEQLREASARRQKMYENQQKARATMAQLPRQAVPSQQTVVQPTQQGTSSQQAVVQPTQHRAPSQQASETSMSEDSTSSTVDLPDASTMRNPIFQQNSESDAKEEEAALALRKKTKVDIKSINANTSKIDKKQAKKQTSAEKKQYASSMYSDSKKAIIAAILIITCPISLAILAIIIGLFLIAVGITIGCVLLGVISLGVSVVSLVICILSLLTVNMPNCIFTLGSALLLFSTGIGICYSSFKLATRVIPSAYFNVLVLFNNVKATLRRFAMK